MFCQKTTYDTEIRGIKNDYVTNAALTNRLNGLKNTHISDKIKKVDGKLKKTVQIFWIIKAD